MSETSQLSGDGLGAAALPAEVPGALRSAVVSWWFAATLFTSALLLFWVQPMVARLLLPLLGGTPTVWNTCMVFFQAVLLAGYAYAHLLTRCCTPRQQMIVHGALLVSAMAVLPIALPETTAPWEANPFVWLIRTLAVMVGLPFFILSTTGPLLQHWFSRLDHEGSQDPYPLYAASNLGSLVALLGYPVVLEPLLRLRDQTQVWAGIYLGFLGLFAGCALRLRRTPAKAVGPVAPAAPVPWSRRWRWMLLAFVPSSLMLGVTTYLTTDIASIPLLWVLPLSLYLLTFVLAFARRSVVPLPVVAKGLSMLAVALIFLLLAEVNRPAWLLVGLHLLFLFLAAMVAHGRLAEDRPPAEQLTGFFLCLSAGGVLGGAFTALVAPVCFRTVLEYPLMLVLACALGPAAAGSPRRPWLFWGGAAGLGVLTALLALLVPRLGMTWHQGAMLLIFGVPLIVGYAFSKRPAGFALALGGVMLGAQCYTAVQGRTLHRERNFFGALRVALDPAGRYRRMYHGTTVHGIQSVDPARRSEPLAYFHRTGPFGVLFAAYASRPANPRIAVIGLGAGAMAAYATPGQHWTFYEIDPAVVALAQNTNYFTYLADADGAQITFKLGDARLRLREAAPESLGLIICDAFSSDVPPLHLITREAMELYLARLAPGGLLGFHISSRYLDFRPVLGNLADHFGLTAISLHEAAVDPVAAEAGKYASHWVVLARRPEHLGALLTDPRGERVAPDPSQRLWTDDYSNLLRIFHSR